MDNLYFGRLQDGPHFKTIKGIAEKCYADPAIQAIWVGGSLAAGTGDAYSDIDFRIAVEPGQIAAWEKPKWSTYLPLASHGATFLTFGEHALLHHHVLAGGTILDFYVQDTTLEHHEPATVIIACRDEAFKQNLTEFESPASPLISDIDGATVRAFLIDYWITTHKEIKGLGRQQDYAHFVGLFFERTALLRAWYMEITGRDLNARVSIHMLGELHRGIGDDLSVEQKKLLGLPSIAVKDTIGAIEGIRTEMSRVGQKLAKAHDFEYPHDLEDTVIASWQEHKDVLARR